MIHTLKNSLGKIFKQPILAFTASRYVGYVLQFLRGILVAKFLGPYLFGIWGFLMLVHRYLLMTSFGMPNAVSVNLSTESYDDSKKQEEFIGASITITVFITIILFAIGGGINLFGISISSKYSLSRYLLSLIGIIGLTHIHQLLRSTYRVYGKLGKIAIGDLLINFILFGIALIYRGEVLIDALLYAMIFSRAVSVFILFINPPFKFRLNFNFKYVRLLFSVGIPLLIKSVSFYLITLSARTIISIFYSVETMGYYSLSMAITNATLLGFNTVAWVVFPNILNKTRLEVDNQAATATVIKVNDLYNTSIFFAVFSVIILLPLLFSILPEYEPAKPVLFVLLLSQGIISVSFGFNCVAIARKRQLTVAFVSMITVFVVTLLGLLAAVLKFHYMWIAVAVLLGSFVYTMLQARLGLIMLGIKKGKLKFMKSMMPIGSIIATIICLILGLMGHLFLGGVVGIIIFGLTNSKRIGLVWSFAYQKIFAV